MSNAYAGGPTVEAPVYLGQTQLNPHQALAHQVVDYLGSNFGYGTVLLILAVGATVVVRKKINRLWKGESKDGK